MISWYESQSFDPVSAVCEVISYATFDSAVGEIVMAGDSRGIRHIEMSSAPRSQVGKLMSREQWRCDQTRFRGEIAQLVAYFAGELRQFEMMLNPLGSAFQLEVWRALTGLDYGTTSTYGAMAEHLGRHRAARAVGAANGCNPIWFVVPCHRLLGANGSLTGYGGGLEVKRALIALERGASFAEALQAARAGET